MKNLDYSISVDLSIDIEDILNSYNKKSNDEKKETFNNLKTKARIFIKNLLVVEDSIDLNKIITTPRKLKLTKSLNLKIQ